MPRRLVAIFISFVLCWTTVACGSSESVQNQSTPVNNSAPARTQISSGKYPVQQATYNDADGEYTLMLLNSTPPIYRTTDLQMARLTDDEIAKGEKTYVEINGANAVMHLSEDFKIEYVHNVVETQTNPQTGQQETVVVRQESNFWAPFAGALAGQALGSLLFTPHYYVPPVYQSGGILRGYGGYGRTYDRAIEQYQTRYNQPPVAVRNRQTLRSTGNIRRYPSGVTTTRRQSPNASRPSGSGVGSSRLRSSGQSNSTKRRSSFGSGSSSRSRSFGSSRRRR
ncbi:MAG: hypothetical protein MUD14_05555 [Hydrococcus sp. Prado102]|jgi:hypothetical protein|nr:hypothetical protein [Hydrococcus sp. Prado102]